MVSPFFASCVMAAQLLLACDDVDANKEYLPGIASGELIATVAIAGDTGSWLPAQVTTTATESNGEWTITGHKSFVLDGAVADLLLVAARTGDGVGVFAVDASAAGFDPHAAGDHGPDPQAGPHHAF